MVLAISTQLWHLAHIEPCRARYNECLSIDDDVAALADVPLPAVSV